MKMCKDCEHYQLVDKFMYVKHLCNRHAPAIGEVLSPITGDDLRNVKNYSVDCSDERDGGLFNIIIGACGKKGKHWRQNEAL